jgi:hypothetical protein
MKKNTNGALFSDRFLDRHAGNIISDTSTAIIELIANAWDAYATQVNITWPNKDSHTPFAITDNGKGMTPEMFEARWRELDYNRMKHEAGKVDPPEELSGLPPRVPYGRNGRGRHAAFRFSDPYRVTTWRDGVEAVYQVRRSSNEAFTITQLNKRDGAEGHGTTIAGAEVADIRTSPEDVRELIGTRFLADPNFQVAVNGVSVTFEDVPQYRISEVEVPVEGYGTAKLIFLDTLKADKTTRQHGIAWRVNNRLVGSTDWSGLTEEKLIDGRRSEAKRFQVIIIADFLAEAVLPDWTGFDPAKAEFIKTRELVIGAISQFIGNFTAARRNEAKAEIKENLSVAAAKLAPVGREKLNSFVDQVMDNCPSITAPDVQKTAEVLANLELSTSKYGLISKLHEMTPGDLDALHRILEEWGIRLVKDALSEIQTRLVLIKNLDIKLRDENADEVAELQPLFEKSLWVFGPEFESIEFTSNKGMTTVIRNLMNKKVKGSRNRPDFVVLPDGSVGFYARDGYDGDYEVGGVERLVIAELKRPGIPIGSEQKEQTWTYVKELHKHGLIKKGMTRVSCFVLGSQLDADEADIRTEWDQTVQIRPLAYDVFIKRAEARMLTLCKKLQEAPFLKEMENDGAAFLATPQPRQSSLELNPSAGRA